MRHIISSYYSTPERIVAVSEAIVNSPSRFLSLACFLLISSTALHAQRFVSSAPSTGKTSASPSDNSGSNSGWGVSGDYDYNANNNFGASGAGGTNVNHAAASSGNAHGGDLSPSQFMDYDQAVALGKKILAEQAASLGDAVRALHQQPRVPQAKGGATVAVQDNHGNVILCRSTDKSCRNFI